MSENTTSQQPNLFAADSLAKMSVSQEIEQGYKVNARPSGRSFIVSFAKFAPDGYLLKMSQGFYQVTMENLPERYSENLPPAGMMRNGELFLLPPLEHCTYESDSSFFPTITSAAGFGGSGAYSRWHKLQSIGEITEQELKAITGRKMSPLFTEWMMGFPSDWSNPE